MGTHLRAGSQVYHALVRRQAALALRQLARDGNTSMQLAGSALSKALNLHMTAEERAWIERIEGLRAELLQSPVSFDELSFGPVSPDSAATDQELAAGIPTTRKVSALAGYSSQPFFNAFLQFRLIREFRPNACLELGASLGLSGAYLAAALHCNGSDGRLTTLEASGERAKLALAHFQRLGLANVSIVEGRFQATLPAILARSAFAWASKDAQHTEEATLAFFETMLPRLDQPALLVFDDVNWSPRMRRAWKRIRSDDRVCLSVDLKRTGVCLIDASVQVKRHVRLPVAGDWLPYRTVG